MGAWLLAPSGCLAHTGAADDWSMQAVCDAETTTVAAEPPNDSFLPVTPQDNSIPRYITHTVRPGPARVPGHLTYAAVQDLSMQVVCDDTLIRTTAQHPMTAALHASILLK